MAFLLEHKVANGQHFVTNQNVGLYFSGNGKAQTSDHAAGKVFDRNIHKIFQLRKFNDAVKMLHHIVPVVAKHRAVQENVFPRGQIHVKTGAQLDHGGNFTVDGNAAAGGVHHAGNHFQHGAFAAAVAPNQRQGFAALHAERNMFQCVKFVKKQLVGQQFYGVFFQGLSFFLRKVKAHGNVIDFNNLVHTLPHVRYTG